MHHTFGVVVAAISLIVLACAAVYLLVIQTHEVDNMDMGNQPLRHRDEEGALSRRPQEEPVREPLRHNDFVSHDDVDPHEDETITMPVAQVDDGRIHLRPGIDSNYDLVSKSVRMFYPEGEMPHRHATYDNDVIDAEIIDDGYEEDHLEVESHGSTRLDVVDGEVVDANNNEKDKHDDKE